MLSGAFRRFPAPRPPSAHGPRRDPVRRTALRGPAPRRWSAPGRRRSATRVRSVRGPFRRGHRPARTATAAMSRSSMGAPRRCAVWGPHHAGPDTRPGQVVGHEGARSHEGPRQTGLPHGTLVREVHQPDLVGLLTGHRRRRPQRDFPQPGVPRQAKESAEVRTGNRNTLSTSDREADRSARTTSTPPGSAARSGSAADRPHLLPRFEQLGHHVAAHVPGRPGHQNHRPLFPSCSSRLSCHAISASSRASVWWKVIGSNPLGHLCGARQRAEDGAHEVTHEYPARGKAHREQVTVGLPEISGSCRGE